LKWSNPVPVSTILQPVSQNGKIGLLILKRAIEPKIGEWSLPGGFMENNGESAEAGALRELFEETGLKIDDIPTICFSKANAQGNLIIVSESKTIWDFDAKSIVLCRENSDFRVMFEPEELCFPIHTRAVTEWFARQRSKRFVWMAEDAPYLSVIRANKNDENN
jgi:ADP-ribose pyrophosphatase YjhB (NUDIX family)